MINLTIFYLITSAVYLFGVFKRSRKIDIPYLRGMDKLTQADRELLDGILKFIPKHGEFTIIEMIYQLPDNIAFLFTGVNHIRIANFLKKNGLVDERGEKIVDTLPQIEYSLTDAGRWLKRFGSIESYQKFGWILGADVYRIAAIATIIGVILSIVFYIFKGN